MALLIKYHSESGLAYLDFFVMYTFNVIYVSVTAVGYYCVTHFRKRKKDHYTNVSVYECYIAQIYYNDTQRTVLVI